MTYMKQFLDLENDKYKNFVKEAFDVQFLDTSFAITKDKIDIIYHVYSELLGYDQLYLKKFLFYFLSIMESFDDIIDTAPNKMKYINYQRLIISYTSFMNIFSIILKQFANMMFDKDSPQIGIIEKVSSDYKYSINHLDILDEEYKVVKILRKVENYNDFLDTTMTSMDVRGRHFHLVGLLLNDLFGIENTEIPNLLVSLNSWFILIKDFDDQSIDISTNSLNIFHEFSSYCERVSNGNMKDLNKFRSEISDRVVERIKAYLINLKLNTSTAAFNSLLNKY